VRPLLDAVLLQRAVARDAGAKQGRGRGHVHLRGDDDGEGLVDDDVRRVAAVRDSAGIALLRRRGAVGADHAATAAVLLVSRLALLAAAARVHHAADAGGVANLELGHLRAHRDDCA